MGDAQISMDSAIAWMRLEGFYADYLAAIIATQATGPNDGSVPEIVPYVVRAGRRGGTPEPTHPTHPKSGIPSPATRPNVSIPLQGELWDGGAGDSDPVWSVALPTIAWKLYEHTGDVGLLAPTYNASLRYLEWMRLRAARGTFGGLLMDYRWVNVLVW